MEADCIVWSVERGMSEPCILPLAEHLAKVYGDCQMFKNGGIFRTYKDSLVSKEHERTYKDSLVSKEHECTQ